MPYRLSVLTAVLASIVLWPLTPEAEPAPPPHAERMACLKAAYGEFIAEVATKPASGRTVFVMKDGSRIPWDDGVAKKPEQRLDKPDLEDQTVLPYPAFSNYPPSGPDDDPGRARVQAFFESVYGRTEKEVRANLVDVVWMPENNGKALKFNRRAGAAQALSAVSRALDILDDDLVKYALKAAGTYVRRPIAGTERTSAHAWGIAVDLDVKYSDYWRWAGGGGKPAKWRNRLPMKIVEIFESRGFIWGGRWGHYDTMHFEYRPELLQPACVAQRPAATP